MELFILIKALNVELNYQWDSDINNYFCKEW